MSLKNCVISERSFINYKTISNDHLYNERRGRENTSRADIKSHLIYLTPSSGRCFSAKTNFRKEVFTNFVIKTIPVKNNFCEEQLACWSEINPRLEASSYVEIKRNEYVSYMREGGTSNEVCPLESQSTYLLQIGISWWWWAEDATSRLSDWWPQS